MQVRLKHSTPNMPIRWERQTYGHNETHLGANITDGAWLGHCSRGGPAAAVDSNWGGRRNFKISHGWYYQDVRCEDRRVEPIVGSTPQYSWHNKLATTYDAKRTGDMFLPLPGPYALSPGEVPRGGQVPRPTDEVGGDPPINVTFGPNGSLLSDDNSQPNPVVSQNATGRGGGMGLFGGSGWSNCSRMR